MADNEIVHCCISGLRRETTDIVRHAAYRVADRFVSTGVVTDIARSFLIRHGVTRISGTVSRRNGGVLARVWVS